MIAIASFVALFFRLFCFFVASFVLGACRMFVLPQKNCANPCNQKCNLKLPRDMQSSWKDNAAQTAVKQVMNKMKNESNEKWTVHDLHASQKTRVVHLKSKQHPAIRDTDQPQPGLRTLRGPRDWSITWTSWAKLSQLDGDHSNKFEGYNKRKILVDINWW